MAVIPPSPPVSEPAFHPRPPRLARHTVCPNCAFLVPREVEHCADCGAAQGPVVLRGTRAGRLLAGALSQVPGLRSAEAELDAELDRLGARRRELEGLRATLAERWRLAEGARRTDLEAAIEEIDAALASIAALVGRANGARREIVKDRRDRVARALGWEAAAVVGPTIGSDRAAGHSDLPVAHQLWHQAGPPCLMTMLSPSGRWLVSRHASVDGRVSVRDLESGQGRTVDAGLFQSMAFSVDERILRFEGGDPARRLWVLDLDRWSGHPADWIDPAPAASGTPDGLWTLQAGAAGVHLMSNITGERRLISPAPARSAAIDAYGRYVASVEVDGGLALHRIVGPITWPAWTVMSGSLRLPAAAAVFRGLLRRAARLDAQDLLLRVRHLLAETERLKGRVPELAESLRDLRLRVLEAAALVLVERARHPEGAHARARAAFIESLLPEVEALRTLGEAPVLDALAQALSRHADALLAGHAARLTELVEVEALPDIPVPSWDVPEEITPLAPPAYPEALGELARARRDLEARVRALSEVG